MPTIRSSTRGPVPRPTEGCAMKQGAARHALADRGDDLYETPACATKALIRHLSLPSLVWEPAAGRGAIVRELAATGISVIATDLVAHDCADAGIVSGV